MFSFKMPSGAGGSPMSMMSNQQKLQALGSAFSGDQQGLSSILAQLQGGQGGGAPVVSQGGQDISAAFGGDFARHGVPRHGDAPQDEGDETGGHGGGQTGGMMGGVGLGLLSQMPLGIIPALLGGKRGFGFGGR
jgi:hypothetical protein